LTCPPQRVPALLLTFSWHEGASIGEDTVFGGGDHPQLGDAKLLLNQAVPLVEVYRKMGVSNQA